MSVAELHVGRQERDDVVHRAHRLVGPGLRDPVPVECRAEDPLRLRGVVADDDRPDPGRALDGRRVTAHRLAVAEQDLLLATDVREPAADVVHVGVLRDQLQGDLLTAPADADRQMALDGQRIVPDLGRRVVRPGRGRLGPIEHPAHDGQRLAQPAQALRESRPELEPIRPVLRLEPRPADTEHRAATRDVVERGRHLGDQRRIPERVGTDHQAERDVLGGLRPRGDRQPAFEVRAI